MPKLIFYMFCVYLVIEKSCAQNTTTVTTPLGKIEGYSRTSVGGRKFICFEGIPYAKPPVRKLRFREPQPVKPWHGIWMANTKYECMQYKQSSEQFGYYDVVGDEDCLYLNIYTPFINTTNPLNVIVMIHGGYFMYNSGTIWSPNSIMDSNVLFVTFNYRLGPLGFLSTGDDLIPGNNGLRDQRLAIKWVKDNILNFGGNPESITIIGENAGAASVHFHFLTENNQEVFHRGVAQSGSALNSWVISEDTVQNTKLLAKQVGCKVNNLKDMIDCLRRRPARQLVYGVKKFLEFFYIPFSPFGVVIDKWSNDPIVPEYPYLTLKKLKTNNLPIIFSSTENDALYNAADFLLDPLFLQTLDLRWNLVCPIILDFNTTVEEADHNITCQNIRDYYFKEKKIEYATFPFISQAMSDRLFTSGIQYSTRMHAVASTGAVYYYVYSYKGKNSRANGKANQIIGDVLGPTQGDDTQMLFGSTRPDNEMSAFFEKLLLTFADSNVPNVGNLEWPPVSSTMTDPFRFLRIYSSKILKVEGDENLGSNLFWESLPTRENQKLYIARDEL